MRRLFLAVNLDDETRHGLAAVLGELPGRPVHPADWHVTLRFLGAVDDSTCDRMVGRLAEEDLGTRFAIRWEGLGGFPRPDKATVLWLGLSTGVDRLTELAGICEQAAQSAGLPAEDRPFRPHLTLSRVRPPRDLARLIAEQSPVGIRMECRRLDLVESRLSRPRGSRYEVVDSFPLV